MSERVIGGKALAMRRLPLMGSCQVARHLTISAFTISHFEGMHAEVSALTAKEIAVELALLRALTSDHPDKAARIDALVDRWAAYRAENRLVLH